jgi:Mg-chelatase subunit ChlD
MKKKKTVKIGQCDATEIAVVMDESGSMATVTNDVIGGYNTFVKEQQKEKGECYLTLAKFNTEATLVFEGTDIQDVKELTRDTYTPGGSTALFDAIVKSIKAIKKRIAGKYMVGRPKVLILVMTDGEENASKECRSKDELKKIIEEVTKNDKFEFMYIGANQDAFANGNAMGIKMSANYVSDSKGTRGAYMKMSSVATCYRATGKTTS